MGSQFHNLVEMLRSRAGETSRGFLFVPDGSGPEVILSYAELDERARALACFLRQQGLAGKRALLCYPPSVDFMVGFFGCVYAQVVAVPAYPPRAHRGDPRLESIIGNCEPAVILTCSDIHRDVERLTAQAPQLRALPWMDTAAMPSAWASGWSDPAPRPGDLVALQYTSGSTGHPKGVMLTHGCLLHNLARMCDVLGLTGQSDAVCWLPAFHDMGLVGNFLQAINCGISLTFMSPAAFAHDPIRWLRTISNRRAYISGGPCFAFQHCVSRFTPQKCAGLDLSCWKVAYIGAEPVSAAVLDRFVTTFGPYGYRGETFFPCYGLAEGTLMVTGGDRLEQPIVRGFRTAALEENRAEPDDQGRQLVGCGRALDDMEVCIVDPITLLPVPEGHIGEIWASGPSLAGGYWNREKESADLFAARRADNPQTRYLRTGDFGFLQKGELFVSGRLKDLIIIRGRNFHPQDLESAVAEAIPELRGHGAAAFAVEADPVARLVIVQEVPRAFKPGERRSVSATGKRRGVSATCHGQELFQKVTQVIADQFELEVSVLVLVKALSIPRSSSGKIRRSETQRLFLAGALEAIEQVTAPEPEPLAGPENMGAGLAVAGLAASIRDWLVARLSRRLNLAPEQIDQDRPFATYMRDSMMMVSMAADLEQWLGRPLSPTLLYSAPTISSLSRKLAGESQGRGASDAALLQGPAPAPIAVVGLGCRFPLADNPDQFWKLLCAGKSVIGDLPEGRWNRIPRSLTTTRAGYLQDVQHFDAAFFGIAPREAVFIDPQHRVLLEVAWEALENAGLAADRLAGKSVGAFVGISNSDYGRLLLQHAGYADAYLGTGNSSSMAAHRLSYHLDLHGPSVAVDTACSSSLVAVHLACQSLRNGECELALAGGINLILAPELTEALSRAGMLSPSACCKTFDAGADGYVRGEGCGLIVLKPLAAALRDGDLVYAVLEASLINQDGRSNGITAPNGGVQTDLVRRTLRLAHREAADVSYLEAHGTGTPLGDPIEFDALQDALGSAKQPCALASVKTNVGHLEAAAGIAGLIKTILQVHHGQIVPHLHLEELNPRINLKDSRFFIPKAMQPWPDEDPSRLGGDARQRVRLAGVSSFGFGGTNAHVLVAQGPVLPEPAAVACVSRSPVASERETQAAVAHCLPLSAGSEPALRELARRYAEWFRQNPAIALADVCANAARGRSHLAQRLTVRGSTSQEIADALQSWAGERRGVSATCQAGTAHQHLSGRIAFLFTGQGSQYPGMAKQLFDACPIFRENLDRCDTMLRDLGFSSIRQALDDSARVDDTDVAQPALFTVGYSLAQTWRHWGIEPAAVLGHSVGEYVAACVAGVFSLEDGLRLIAERGRLMQACPEGAMLACFAPLAEIQEHLERWQDLLSIAAINGPESIVVAGDPGTVAAVQEEFAAFGVETRALHVRRAFHSRLIEPALAGLQKVAATITHRPPSIRLISNKTGDFFSAAPTPQYWAEHARVPVQFVAGIQALSQAGISHFLEIGPEAALSRLGPTCISGPGERRSVSATSPDAVWLHSLRRGKDDWTELLGSVGKLYVDGAAVDWERLDNDQRRPRVVLPTYPFQRQRFWIDDLPRGSAPADDIVPAAQTVAPAEVQWLPRSNWSEAIPRSSTGLDRLAGGLEAATAPVVAKVKEGHAPQMFAVLRAEFDRLAGGYVVNTVRQLGWRPSAGERFETELLADRLKVLPAYHRLLGRLLEMAAEDGWLDANQDEWRVIKVPGTVDVQAGHEDFVARHEDFAVELKLAHRCAVMMHTVMRGQQDPLQVLFGDGAAQLTEQLYEKSPVARFYNDLLAGCVEKLLLPLAEQRPIRVLEVGAGTGGTTAYLLPRLPAGRTEYVFTDVSQLFLVRARDKFRGFPFVEYRLFDLEKEPEGQGFADGQFDLIMGSNVFHATGDLRQSLRNVRRLLASSGLLVMLEGTGRRRLLDMIFGLTEGWWKFRDADLRQGCPLLSSAGWSRLLTQEKFAEVAAVPGPDPILTDPDQVVIMARAGEQQAEAAPTRNGTIQDKNGQPTDSSPVTWLVFSDRSELADGLLHRLEQDGEAAVQVLRGDLFAWEGKSRCWVRPGEAGDVEALLAEDHARAQERSIRVVDFTATSADRPWPRVERHWVVTRGLAPMSGTGQTDGAGVWNAFLQGQTDPKLCLIDLDAGWSAADQASCLREALRHYDEQNAVVYRGDQRYVPQRAAAIGAGSAAGSQAEIVDRQALLTASPVERRAMVEGYLRREFANVLGIELTDDDMSKPLQAFGLDSLMGIQFRNRVEAGLGVSLSIVDFLKGLSLGQIVDNALAELAPSAGSQVGLTPRRSPKDRALPKSLTTEKVQSLSEGELDTLLQSLLE